MNGYPCEVTGMSYFHEGFTGLKIMTRPLYLCRRYLDFHYLDQIFRKIEDIGFTIQYTVVSSESRPLHFEDDSEWQLTHAFIKKNTSEARSLIIMIHEEWFIRCERSSENGPGKAQLNEEFNRFVLKVLRDVKSKLTLNAIPALNSPPIPALNSPPQPPSDSEMAIYIRNMIQQLTEHGGPNYGENTWVYPTHGYSFG